MYPITDLRQTTYYTDDQAVGNTYRNFFTPTEESKKNIQNPSDLERSPENGDAFIKEDYIDSKLCASIKPKQVLEGIGLLTAALTGLKKLIEEGKSLKEAIDELFPKKTPEQKAELMSLVTNI